MLEGGKQVQDVYAKRERWGGKFTRAVREGRSLRLEEVKGGKPWHVAEKSGEGWAGNT